MEKLILKEKIGYGIGDVGINLFFSVVLYLQVFYTDILLIDLRHIMVLFVVARIWDAVNDPLVGTIIDTRPKLKHGKYRGYMRFFSYPLALATVLCFLQIPNLSTTGTLLYAYMSYILFGMIATFVTIPYGALANAMTNDPNDRASLSTFRSLGSAIGTSIPGIIFPLFVFTQVATVGGTAQVLNHNMLLLGYFVVAVLGLISVQISTRWTRERIESKTVKMDSREIRKTILNLLKNKAYLVVVVVGIAGLTIAIVANNLNIIVFRDYFGDAKLLTINLIISVIPSAIMLPISLKLVQKYGKKEMASLGLLVGTVLCFILFIIKTTNPYTFIALYSLIFLAGIFLSTQLWGMIGDVIDFHEYKHSTRHEALSYSFIMFGRRLGWAVAGFLAPLALSMSKYVVDPTTQIASVDTGILYAWATLIPAFGYLLMFILIKFVYPLSKDKMQEVSEELQRRHATFLP